MHHEIRDYSEWHVFMGHGVQMNYVCTFYIIEECTVRNLSRFCRKGIGIVCIFV